MNHPHSLSQIIELHDALLRAESEVRSLRRSRNIAIAEAYESCDVSSTAVARALKLTPRAVGLIIASVAHDEDQFTD
jgi:hypothetical protein